MTYATTTQLNTEIARAKAAEAALDLRLKKLEAPVVPPLPGWTLLVRENFDTPCAEGAFLATYPNMTAYPNAAGWDDSPNVGHYDPSIISVHDGMADVFIHTSARTSADWGTVDPIHRIAAFGPILGPIADNDTFKGQINQLYGRYEIRAKVDSMVGYKCAWLLWPKSETWPRDGEIDAPEGGFDGKITSAFMHRQGATTGSDQDAYSSGVTMNDWHVWITEWTPTAVRFLVDGRLYGTSTARIPNTPMHWVIQNETLIGGPVPADSVQGHILVDYVAVWAYAP